MMPFVRGEVPEPLASNGPTWAQDWHGRREKARQNGERLPTFDWPRWRNQKVNILLMPELLVLTEEHCAFCDGYPLDGNGKPTIEHFKPKSTFPLEAFAWSNLYPACFACNAVKREHWDVLLLRPDEIGYTFDRYFKFKRATGEIEANPRASAEDHARAEVTIRLFHINRMGRPQARLRAIKLFGLLGADGDLPLFPFRFALLPLAIPQPSQ